MCDSENLIKISSSQKKAILCVDSYKNKTMIKIIYNINSWSMKILKKITVF